MRILSERKKSFIILLSVYNKNTPFNQLFKNFYQIEGIAQFRNVREKSLRSGMPKRSTGVNTFIDLTNPKDFHRKLSYRKTLLQASQEIDRKVELEFFPLPFHAGPERQQVQRILKYIAKSLKQGQRVYIHAGDNLEGRTPLILACLLIQRGYSNEKALAKVNAFWSKTLHFLIRTPLSELQQKFILDW